MPSLYHANLRKRALLANVNVRMVIVGKFVLCENSRLSRVDSQRDKASAPVVNYGRHPNAGVGVAGSVHLGLREYEVTPALRPILKLNPVGKIKEPSKIVIFTDFFVTNNTYMPLGFPI